MGGWWCGVLVVGRVFRVGCGSQWVLPFRGGVPGTVRGEGAGARCPGPWSVVAQGPGRLVSPPIRTLTVGAGLPPAQPVTSPRRGGVAGSRTITAGSDFHRPRSTLLGSKTTGCHGYRQGDVSRVTDRTLFLVGWGWSGVTSRSRLVSVRHCPCVGPGCQGSSAATCVVAGPHGPGGGRRVGGAVVITCFWRFLCPSTWPDRVPLFLTTSFPRFLPLSWHRRI